MLVPLLKYPQSYLMGIFPELESRHPNIAFLYALVGNISLALMQIFFKYLSAVVSPLQILFLRGWVLFWLNSLFLRKTRREVYLGRPQCCCGLT